MDEFALPYVDQLSAEQLDRINALAGSDLSVDQRWAEYAREFGWGAGGGSRIDKAKDAVRQRLGELRKLLCEDAAIGKIAASPTTGAGIALASVINGKLVSSHFGGVDVVQLGVLLAQIGLLSVCRGEI
jgi:hypothetical protein